MSLNLSIIMIIMNNYYFFPFKCMFYLFIFPYYISYSCMCSVGNITVAEYSDIQCVDIHPISDNSQYDEDHNCRLFSPKTRYKLTYLSIFCAHSERSRDHVGIVHLGRYHTRKLVHMYHNMLVCYSSLCYRSLC